jgi:hypothetical protein
MIEPTPKDSAEAQGCDMQKPTPLDPIGSKLKATVRVAVFFFLVTQSPLCPAAVYKCIAKDGSTAYSDAPCATDAQTAVVNTATNSLAQTTPSPTPNTSKPDPSAMHCALAQYIPWVRAQGRPLDPELKAKKLKEIDQACGSSLHLSNVQTAYDSPLKPAQTPNPPVAAAPLPPVAPVRQPSSPSTSPTPPAAAKTVGEFPAVPEKNLPLLKAIPRQGEFVVEVGDSFGHMDSTGMTYRSDISIFDLSSRKEFRWDLPRALLEGLPPQSSLHRAAWISHTSTLFFAKLNEASMISRDGSTRALSLQMPGHLKPFDGIETYAMSGDGQFIAFYLYTRDVRELQPDGFGKLYMDLMFEKTAGSPPTTIMRKTRPSALAWSPDGQRIAYGTYDGQVIVLDRSGKQLQSVRAGAPPGQYGIGSEMIWDLKWRPDGQDLGILVYPTRHLLLMNQQGNLKSLQVKSTGLFKKEVTLNSFAWSPNGRKLAFRSAFEASENCNHLALSYKFDTGNFPCLNGSNLYTSNVDGTGLERITPSTDYAYASQGELFWVQ